MRTEQDLLKTQPPVIAYARLLIENHRLIGEGKGDGEEAEALADRMDAPWHAMTALEQSRMRGLSADLYALREGGPKRVEMAPEQLAAWKRDLGQTYNRGEAGDADAFLNFLRKPVPSRLPRQIIPFLQARCWEKLGDLETALVFMKEADRLDPDQALYVLLLLQKLGREEEAAQYANRVIANPSSPPLELYLAAVALLSPTRGMSDVQARPILQQVAPVFKQALSRYLALSPEEKAECPGADAPIVLALGLGLERLGDLKSAIGLYTEAIERHPRNGVLFAARGLTLYGTDAEGALADFVKAVRFGVAAIWPYVILARHALQNGASAEALRLALLGEHQPGPDAERAEVYETIAMALAELGQPQERVLENFDKALAFDPTNDRIRENREIAFARPSASQGTRGRRPRLRQAPPIKPEGLRRSRSDQISNLTGSLNESIGLAKATGTALAL